MTKRSSAQQLCAELINQIFTDVRSGDETTANVICRTRFACTRHTHTHTLARGYNSIGGAERARAPA